MSKNTTPGQAKRQIEVNEEEERAVLQLRGKRARQQAAKTRHASAVADAMTRLAAGDSPREAARGAGYRGRAERAAADLLERLAADLQILDDA